MAALERCAHLGVTVTVTAVMMSLNYDQMALLARVAATVGANLRVNVYQPSKTEQFTLSYAQFWDGFKRLADATRLIATTEPVLAGVLGLEGFVGPACGRSTVRVAPDGRVLPCTYWPQSHLTLADLQGLGEHITQTPEFRAASSAPSAAVAVLADALSLGICRPQTRTVRLPGMITLCLIGNKSRMKICPKLGVLAPRWSRQNERGV
jgi:hypothetical protein